MDLRVEGVFTAYDGAGFARVASREGQKAGASGHADVLEDVTLTVLQGRITCLLGSNGSGKTTLIRSILGLTKPRRGRILFGATDLMRLPTHRIIANGIAAIPEGRKVFPRLTVTENLRLGAYLERDPEKAAGRMARVFEIFPVLAQRRSQLAGTMSGGEQAMVSIGRGLMGAPKLLLVDEPSLGLSPLFVKENFAVLRKVNESGVTIFLVEQNVHQTLAIAHQGYVLSKGRVVARGTAQELLENDEVRKAYFGEGAA